MYCIKQAAAFPHQSGDESPSQSAAEHRGFSELQTGSPPRAWTCRRSWSISGRRWKERSADKQRHLKFKATEWQSDQRLKGHLCRYKKHKREWVRMVTITQRNFTNTPQYTVKLYHQWDCGDWKRISSLTTREYKWKKSSSADNVCGKDLQGCWGQAWCRRVSQPAGIYPAHRSRCHTEKKRKQLILVFWERFCIGTLVNVQLTQWKCFAELHVAHKFKKP